MDLGDGFIEVPDVYELRGHAHALGYAENRTVMDPLQPPGSPAVSQPRSQPLFRPRKHDDGTSGN
jgi:hypothetical protein